MNLCADLVDLCVMIFIRFFCTLVENAEQNQESPSQSNEGRQESS